MKIAIGPSASMDRISHYLPGIKSFLEERTDVEVFLYNSTVHEKMLPSDLDGALVCQPGPDTSRLIYINDLPIVCIQGLSSHSTVRFDHAAGGRMAARFFIQRGFRKFGFFMDGTDLPNGEIKLKGYQKVLSEEGIDCDVFFQGRRTIDKGKWFYDDQQADLAEWVCQSPKPFAVLCANDQHACRLIAAAKIAKVSIPDQLAIVGIRNVEPICELSKPTISSVHFDPASLGYAGISWLVDKIEGPVEDETDTIYVQPSSVVERQSTNIYALNDPDMVAALKYIKEHVTEAIKVEDVADHVNLSRSSLERRFKDELNISPGQYLRQSRIDYAIRLLHESRMSLIEIAEKSGFSTSSQLSRDIKEYTGKTPTQLRKGL